MEVEVRCMHISHLEMVDDFYLVTDDFMFDKLDDNMKDLYQAYDTFFMKYNLDIQYKLEKSTWFNNVMFIPIRPIDKLAMKAIITMK
jgi:hypothetical protein